MREKIKKITALHAGWKKRGKRKLREKNAIKSKEEKEREKEWERELCMHNGASNMIFIKR